MLALARKVNESIIINDNVEVTILEIKGDQIKIGICFGLPQGDLFADSGFQP